MSSLYIGTTRPGFGTLSLPDSSTATSPPPASEFNMPRRSSGGRSASRPAPRRPSVRNAPQPVRHAPPPAPAQSGGGSMLGSLGSTIAQGVAFGTGSAVAHRAVDAVMGPRTIQHETVPSESPAPTMSASGSDACTNHNKAFQDCLSSYGSDIGKCQFYLDMLTQCRQNSGSMVA